MQNEAEEGYYSWKGAVREEPCPLGTFQPVGKNQYRIPSCLKCTVKISEWGKCLFKVIPLSINPTQRRGAQSCVECQGGRLCNQTGLSQPPLCPTGNYCPPGSSVARPCPPVSICVFVWMFIQLFIVELQSTSLSCKSVTLVESLISAF